MFELIIPFHIVFLYLLSQVEITSYFFLEMFLFWLVLGGIGLELGYHRILCHNHFQVSKRLKLIFFSLGTLTLNGSPLFFRTLHVKYHHPNADQPQDFTSFKNGGILNSYLLFLVKAKKMKLQLKQSEELRLFLKVVHRYYLLINYTVVAIGILFPNKTVLALMAAMVACYHQNALVSALSHGQRGYRNFATPDMSNNIKWLSYFTFGLALHNNHHAKPEAPNFAVAKGELDLGFELARFLRLRNRIEGRNES